MNDKRITEMLNPFNIDDDDLKHSLVMGSTRAGMRGMSALMDKMIVEQATAGGTVFVFDVGHGSERMMRDIEQVSNKASNQ